MDAFDEPPEVQIPTPAPATKRGSQPELAAAEPPQLPPEAPPAVAPPVVPGAVKKDGNPYAWVFWTVGIVAGIVILAAVFGSGSGSGSSSNGNSSSGGGGFTPPPASAPLDLRPLSKALDEKNGFKDFRFGMTLNEAMAVLEPTRVTRNPGANEETFLYSGSSGKCVPKLIGSLECRTYAKGESWEVVSCRNELALRQRPIGKPRPQRLCFECIEDGRSLAFLNAPLRTGLSDRSHFQWFRLFGTHFPDEPTLGEACRLERVDTPPGPSHFGRAVQEAEAVQTGRRVMAALQRWAGSRPT